MTMKKVLTTRLTGAALNYAVAKAEGFKLTEDGLHYLDTVDAFMGEQPFPIPDYANDWSAAGPIVEANWLQLCKSMQIEPFNPIGYTLTNGSRLIASWMIKRVFLAFGEEVEVPASFAD